MDKKINKISQDINIEEIIIQKWNGGIPNFIIKEQ